MRHSSENVARETRVALGVGAREREMGGASMGFSEESNMYLRALDPLSSTTLTHNTRTHAIAPRGTRGSLKST